MCDNSTNHWAPYKTLYWTDSGVCSPTEGTYTEWKPTVAPGNHKVRVTLKDELGPNDDDDRVEWVDVSAFTVGVEMQVVASGQNPFPTELRRMWEADVWDRDVHHFQRSLELTAFRSGWAHPNPGTDNQRQTVHISYTYISNPPDAVLQQPIGARLSTACFADLATELDDADISDGTVSFQIAFTYTPQGGGWGFQINGPTINWGEDCAEAISQASLGFNGSDGLGPILDPNQFLIINKSSVNDDAWNWNFFCGNIPEPLSQSYYEPFASTKSTFHWAGATIYKYNRDQNVVHGQWDGFARVEIAGSGPGAQGTATVGWLPLADIDDVWYGGTP